MENNNNKKIKLACRQHMISVISMQGVLHQINFANISTYPLQHMNGPQTLPSRSTHPRIAPRHHQLADVIMIQVTQSAHLNLEKNITIL